MWLPAECYLAPWERIPRGHFSKEGNMDKQRIRDLKMFVRLWNFFYFIEFARDCPEADVIEEETEIDRLYTDLGNGDA